MITMTCISREPTASILYVTWQHTKEKNNDN